MLLDDTFVPSWGLEVEDAVPQDPGGERPEQRQQVENIGVDCIYYGRIRAPRRDHAVVIGAFTTERLRLRPMRADDIDLLVDLNSDEEVMKHISGRASTADESATELRGALGTRWLVFAKASHEFLGWIGAVPGDDKDEFDVGWRFRRAWWGQGYASEAAIALIDRLFEAGARRVFAQTMVVNMRSRALMERIGLQHARTFHLHFDDPLPGTEYGEIEYGLTAGDWLLRRTQSQDSG